MLWHIDIKTSVRAMYWDCVLYSIQLYSSEAAFLFVYLGFVCLFLSFASLPGISI